MLNKSPLAPASFPTLIPIDGVRLAATASGAHYRGRDDLMLAVVDDGAVVAGVFTQSAILGAPVIWNRRQLRNAAPRALIVNAGNANAFTGSAGERHVAETCQAVAARVGCQPEQVLAASTGVIGEPFPVDKIIDAIPALKPSSDRESWERCAAAITTTDTFAKGATVATRIDGTPVNITGFAKGSGMIEPNMATMLAFIFTDADIPPAPLQSLLEAANEKTFNAITVDSDTSTSDTCLLFATGKAGNTPVADLHSPALHAFKSALQEVMEDLAVQVVRDGEGARKLIQIDVSGAEDDRAAGIVAKSIANSPLVKTAIAGEDANWGRLVMAVGKAGQKVNADRLKIVMGGVAITDRGRRIEPYDETPVSAHLKGAEISIAVDLGVAQGCARVWTCDLTHGYIEINADYRS